MLPLVTLPPSLSFAAPMARRAQRSGRLALWGAALAVTLPLQMATAADTKIGVIDSQRIFAEFQEARDAEAAFQTEMKKWQDDLVAQEKEIATLQDKIRSQALLLSKEKLDELQGDLDKKFQAYEAAKNDLFDPTKGKAVARNKELSQPINDKITTVVERLGAEQSFTIILDMASVNVVYMDKTIDLTDKVLEELGKSGK